MIYLEDTAALEYWMSPARAAEDGRKFPLLSSLANCPTTARDSVFEVLEDVACDFTRLTLAVPGNEFRVQRNAVSYHVWTRPIPRNSFCAITEKVAVATPALCLVQVARKLSQPHFCQVACSMLGSYLTPHGTHAGLLDELTPLVTIQETIDMANELRGLYSPEHVLPSMKYVAENSASPRETQLLLLVSMTKKKGGLNRRGWEMNVELDVPYKLRKYWGYPTIKPDLLMADKMAVLEYESDEWHDNFEAMQRDEKRRIVLQAMGYKVVPIYTADLKDAYRFENVAPRILNVLGEKYPGATDSQMIARQRLINEMRSNPWIG